jgi:hypothetical protein
MDEYHLRRIRIRRGTNSQRKEVLFEEGEFVYVNDIKRLYVGDRKTYGGVRVTNNNHVENSAIRPINSDVGDLLYNKTDKATYIVDRDGSLKKIIYPTDSNYFLKKQLSQLELLLLKLEKLCCNTEFALDTDDGKNVLVDYGDWIRVKEYDLNNIEYVECKPPIISEKYLNLKTNTTYTLNILDSKSSNDIIFVNNFIDRDQNTPPQNIKIVENSVNSSNDINIIEVTDTTIKFSANLPDSKTIISLGTYIDYSIQNSCSAIQEENASVTGIIYNNSIAITTVELDTYNTRVSDKFYTMYKLIDPITGDYPWNLNCWFLFYFDNNNEADNYYITEIGKRPKLINGNWYLDKKTYGVIGSISNKGIYLFWHPKDLDLNVWNQGKGNNTWGVFPLFDPSKHINDENHYYTNENVKPTIEQINKCLSFKNLETTRKDYTDIYTKSEIPPYISI